jgi:hypothetical protein
MTFFKALFLFLDDFLYKGYIDEEYESEYDESWNDNKKDTWDTVLLDI